MGSGGASAMLPILAGVGVGVATGNPLIGLGVASGGSALMSGYAGMQASEFEADQMKQAAKTAEVQGEQRANEIRRQLMSTLGAQQAALASRGVALGTGGTPDVLAAEASRRFAEDLRVNRLNTLTEQSAARAGASQAKSAGQASMFGGLTQAATSGFVAFDQYRSLGTVPGTKRTGGLSSPARNAYKGGRGSYSGPKPLLVRR